jgi:hypothetical protein
MCKPDRQALFMENALLGRGRLYKIAHHGRQDTIILVRARGVTDRTAALSPIVKSSFLAALSTSAAFLLCGLVPLGSYLMTYSFALRVATNWPGILRHRGLEDPMVRRLLKENELPTLASRPADNVVRTISQ